MSRSSDETESFADVLELFLDADEFICFSFFGYIGATGPFGPPVYFRVVAKSFVDLAPETLVLALCPIALF